jgi:5'-3' exonuclease
MRLLAVDGTNAIMRQASVDDSTPGAIAESTVKRILNAATDLECTHMIVALDALESWRYASFPDYKGAQTSPGGKSTTEYSLALGEALEARRIKVVAHRGYEADDILATVAHRLAAGGRECYLLSSDNDLFQLTELPTVKLVQYAPKGSAGGWLTVYDAASCVEKFGVLPKYYATFLTLVGGKNKVPGMPGIGPKKAVKALQKGGLDQLITLGIVPSEQAEWLRTALKLHTLVADVPLETIDPKTCKVP